MDGECPRELSSRGTDRCPGEEDSEKLDGDNNDPYECNGEEDDDPLGSFPLAFDRDPLRRRCALLGESVSGLTFWVASRPARKRENSFGPCLSSTTTSGAPSRSTASWTSVRIPCRRSYVKYCEYLGCRSYKSARCVCGRCVTGRLRLTLTRKAPANVTNTNWASGACRSKISEEVNEHPCHGKLGQAPTPLRRGKQPANESIHNIGGSFQALVGLYQPRMMSEWWYDPPA